MLEEIPRHGPALAEELREAGEAIRLKAEDRRNCYWLYVVTNCASAPELQEPISDPARFLWHEVRKVQHYWMDVKAMTGPMRAAGGDDPKGGSPA